MRLTNTVKPSCVGKCLRLTFSSDLQEAMFETGESLSAISKFNSVIEKINQSTYDKCVIKTKSCTFLVTFLPQMK